MRLKKAFALILICAVLFSCLPAGAFAVEDGIRYGEVRSPVLYNSPEDMGTSLQILENYADVDLLREAVLSDVAECNTRIDISDFNIPVAYIDNVADFIWYHTPEAFSVDSIGYSYYAGMIMYLIVDYRSFSDTKAEYAACMAEFMAAADSMLQGIEGNSSLTDVQKALLLHDRLALHTEYDYVSSSVIKHTAYGAFSKGAAVCQGYAMAYMYLLQRIGIKNYYCSSDKLNHGWNIIYINNKPYHVDVTWDDRAWGSYGRGFIGRVNHNNFLRSTTGIIATGHNADDFEALPVDRTYDNYFWQKSSAAFQLAGNEIYYIDNEAGQLIRLSDSRVLCDVSDAWRSSSGGIWTSNFACLSVAGKNLLYSLTDGVYMYSPETDSSQRIYSPSLSTNYSVFGFDYKNGYLVCDINNTPNNATYLSQVKKEYSVTCLHKNKQNKPAEESTCVTAGYSAGVYCNDCEKYISGHTRLDIDSTAHKWDSGVITTAATCSVSGVKTYTCEYDKTHKRTEDMGLDKSKHIHTKNISKEAATCVVEGYSAGVYCNDCEKYISGHTRLDIDSTAHKWDSGVITTAATCSVSGVKTYTCEYDKTHKRTEDMGLDKSKHIHTELVDGIPATAESVGYTEGVYCNDCLTYISGHKEIAKLTSVFTDGENAVADGTFILFAAGLTAEDILKLSSDKTVIKDKDGNTVDESFVALTGMTLVLPDGKEYSLVCPGDVNSDGAITAADARFVLRASVGLEKIKDESAEYKAANIDGSGIAASDARLILRASVGLEDSRKWITVK